MYNRRKRNIGGENMKIPKEIFESMPKRTEEEIRKEDENRKPWDTKWLSEIPLEVLKPTTNVKEDKI